MKITMYKGALLNNSYLDVFSKKQLLEDYLSSFSNDDKITLTLNATYGRLNGSLPIEIPISINNMVKYNYIKIEDNAVNSNTIYAFVDNIELIDGIYVLEYSCDYWHTFLGDWNLRSGILKNTRYVPENIPYNQLLDYQTNEQIVMKRLSKTGEFETIIQESVDLQLIVELQLYKQTQVDAVPIDTINKLFRVVIPYYAGDKQGKVFNKHPTTYLSNISPQEMDKVLDTLTLYMAREKSTILQEYLPEEEVGKPIGEVDRSKAYNFNITNVYVIPQGYGNKLFVNSDVTFASFIAGDVGQYYRIELGFEPIKPLDNLTAQSYFEISSGTIKANPYIKSWGFTNKQIPYIYNGLDQEYSVCASYTESAINFYLLCNQNYIEITECFTTELNFSVVDASTLALNRLEKKIATAKGISKIITGTFDTAFNIMSFGTYNAISKGFNALAGLNYQKGNIVSGGYAELNKTKYQMSAVNSVSNASNGIGSIVDGIADIQRANASVYNNARVVDNNAEGRFVAQYSICVGVIEVPNNDLIVNKVNSVIGYNVFIPTSSIDVVDGIDDYNSILFQNTEIVGCTSYINNIIESILEKGVRIWYKKTIDNLYV